MQLNIAILGTRGIPNHYGGFEYVAAALGEGLVKKGHRVTVYNSHRHPYREKEWNGVRIIHRYDPEHVIGMAGQFVYDMNCIRHTRGEGYDIILMLGYTSSSVWGFLYPQKATIITNMDGLEWQRTKYSTPAKRFLKYAEELAVRPGRFYIADSPVIKEYLDTKYNIDSKYIAYGADPGFDPDETLLSAFGLGKKSYFLLMARMEPENNIEIILDGFCSTKAAVKFVVIGNTGNSFGKYLVKKYKNEERILFTSAIFDEQKVKTLTAFCRLYFHGHSVGGTNPSLLAAMAAAPPLTAHDNRFNRSVLKENALFFKTKEDVADIINAGQYVNELHMNSNAASVKNDYNWELITAQYEDYFFECHSQSVKK